MISEDLYELDSMGGTVEGVLPGLDLIVAFDHPILAMTRIHLFPMQKLVSRSVWFRSDYFALDN